MTNALSVWWDGAEAGVLRLDENGDLAFAYAEAWLADESRLPISVSLPRRAEPFNRRETRPFFAGLLPEEGQREAVARALGVSKANDFRLLEGLGGEVAGALTLWPQGEAPPPTQGLASTDPLNDRELVDLLDTLPRRPFLAGEGGIRLSLAGAQQKLPVVLANGRIALPAPGQPTTHILKPPVALCPTTTENEAFAMRLAAAVGLSVAPVEPRKTDGRAYLLVERYDRALDTEGGVWRLHQEDFCQALGVPPESKYAAEGGPIFSDCFDLMRRATARPAIAILRLLDAAIYNVIVGNADAHGKNYSLLYAQDGPEFAPLYDLLCTAAYPEIHPKLAMKVGRRAVLEDFRGDTWEVFAGEIGVRPPFVRRRVAELARAVQAAATEAAAGVVAAGFDEAVLEALSQRVQARATRVLEGAILKKG